MVPWISMYMLPNILLVQDGVKAHEYNETAILPLVD